MLQDLPLLFSMNCILTMNSTVIKCLSDIDCNSTRFDVFLFFVQVFLRILAFQRHCGRETSILTSRTRILEEC